MHLGFRHRLLVFREVSSVLVSTLSDGSFCVFQCLVSIIVRIEKAGSKEDIVTLTVMKGHA
jgi:hypothetical protein